MIIEYGKGFKITETMSNWCDLCYIYVLVEVVEDGRYWLTATAEADEPSIFENRPFYKFANAQEQACYAYFISNKERDIKVDVNQYQGRMGMYFKARAIPDGPDDESNTLVAEIEQGSIMIISGVDRQAYGYGTGQYYLCFYGYEPSSLKILITEATFENVMDLQDNIMMNFNVIFEEASVFQYSNNDLAQRS